MQGKVVVGRTACDDKCSYAVETPAQQAGRRRSGLGSKRARCALSVRCRFAQRLGDRNPAAGRVIEGVAVDEVGEGRKAGQASLSYSKDGDGDDDKGNGAWSVCKGKTRGSECTAGAGYARINGARQGEFWGHSLILNVTSVGTPGF